MCRRDDAQKGQDMSTEITKSESKRKATKKAKAAKTTKQAGKGTKSVKANKPKDTKKERVLELLRRKEGATIAEIAKATSWQNHSIRGFLSGTLTKKMGLKIESSKNEGEGISDRLVNLPENRKAARIQKGGFFLSPITFRLTDYKSTGGKLACAAILLLLRC